MSSSNSSGGGGKVTKTDAEWRAQLSPEAYQITRRGATERPFTGEYDHHFEQGKYYCVCCHKLLFGSEDKFNSGCGWPAFSKEASATDGSAIKIDRIEDTSFGMKRVEVRCSSCDAHLGHVFNDGPRPTGERYCINSACLVFKAKEK